MIVLLAAMHLFEKAWEKCVLGCCSFCVHILGAKRLWRGCLGSVLLLAPPGLLQRGCPRLVASDDSSNSGEAERSHRDIKKFHTRGFDSVSRRFTRRCQLFVSFLVMRLAPKSHMSMIRRLEH